MEQECDLTIVVNTQDKTWRGSTIDYEGVVKVAFPPPHGPNEVFTVSYTRGPNECQGTLVAGQKTPCCNGMVFDVTRTDKS